MMGNTWLLSVLLLGLLLVAEGGAVSQNASNTAREYRKVANGGNVQISSLTLKHSPALPRAFRVVAAKLDTGPEYAFIKREAYKMKAQLLPGKRQFFAIWLLDVPPGALGTAPFRYNPFDSVETLPLLNTGNDVSPAIAVPNQNFIVARTAGRQHSEDLIEADMPNNNLRPTRNTQTVLCYSWYVPCSTCAHTVCNIKALFPTVPNFIVAYSNRWPPNPTRDYPDQTEASRATMRRCHITLLHNALVTGVVERPPPTLERAKSNPLP